MATYNALDNEKIARELLTQLILEENDIGSSIEYDYATSVCDDCPNHEREPQSYSEQEWGVHYAPTCCKEDGTFEAEYQPTFEHIARIQRLRKSIVDYLGNRELKP